MDRPVFDVRGLKVTVPQAQKLDPTTAQITYLFVPADSLISTSRGTAQGIIGRPDKTRIFEQNISHRPEPAYLDKI